MKKLAASTLAKKVSTTNVPFNTKNGKMIAKFIFGHATLANGIYVFLVSNMTTPIFQVEENA